MIEVYLIYLIPGTIHALIAIEHLQQSMLRALIDNFDQPEYDLLYDKQYISEVLDTIQPVLPVQNPKEYDQYYKSFLDLDDQTEQLGDQDIEVVLTSDFRTNVDRNLRG